MKLRNARRLALVAMAMAPIAGLPGTAVASGSGEAAIVGTAHLPKFPCPAPGCSASTTPPTNGTFSSLAVVGADGSGVIDRVTASFSYVEPCTGGLPLTGTADGDLFAWHGGNRDAARKFHWERTGLVAVLSGQVTGVAVFVPQALPACGDSAPVDAVVAGAGVF